MALLVKDMMKKNIITIEEDAMVNKICLLLTKHKISGLPVVNKKKNLVGFISERDIIVAIPKNKFLSFKAKNIMKKNVKAIAPDDPISNAFKIFSKEIYRHLPVIKNQKVIGIISRKDVIAHILSSYH